LLVVACAIQFAQQAEVLRVMRETYQAIIDREEEAISAAKSLLQLARYDSARLAEVAGFFFPPVQGEPGLDDLTRQAETYVEVYDRLIQVRHKAFSLPRKDSLRLIRAAQRELDPKPEVPAVIEAKPKKKRASAKKAKARPGLDCQV
jgi:hypothetical protein